MNQKANIKGKNIWIPKIANKEVEQIKLTYNIDKDIAALEKMAELSTTGRTIDQMYKKILFQDILSPPKKNDKK